MIRAALALLIVLVLGAIFNAHGAFFEMGTHFNSLRQASVYGLLACGMTLVIITGGIDLSVGSVMGLVAVCFSLFSIWKGWPAPLALAASLAVGAACGLVNGILVTKARMQPFIATLAMMVFARGLGKWSSGGLKVAPSLEGAAVTTLPSVFESIDSHVFGTRLSMVSVIFVVCALITGVLLARHQWGRSLYAIGGSEEAARLAGIQVGRAKTLAYVVAGLMASVAGICQAAQEQQGDPEAGRGYELFAISMVVMGGTSLAGGKGSMAHTMLGVLIISYLDKILSINAVPEANRLMLTGVIFVIAVLAQRTKG